MMFNEDLSLETRDMLDRFDDEFIDAISQEFAEEQHRDNLQ